MSAMGLAGTDGAHQRPVPTNRRSGTPEPWELPLLATLGARLQGARESAGMTPLELATRIGLGPEAIRDVEQGRHRTRPVRIREWLAVTRAAVDVEAFLSEFAPVIGVDTEPRRRWQPAPPPQVIPKASPAMQAELGAILWRMREQADLSRPALAQRAGISRFSVWLIEHGAQRPSTDMVDRWSDATRGARRTSDLQAALPGAIAESSRPLRPRTESAPGSIRPSANGTDRRRTP